MVVMRLVMMKMRRGGWLWWWWWRWTWWGRKHRFRTCCLFETSELERRVNCRANGTIRGASNCAFNCRANGTIRGASKGSVLAWECLSRKRPCRQRAPLRPWRVLLVAEEPPNSKPAPSSSLASWRCHGRRCQVGACYFLGVPMSTLHCCLHRKHESSGMTRMPQPFFLLFVSSKSHGLSWWGRF